MARKGKKKREGGESVNGRGSKMGDMIQGPNMQPQLQKEDGRMRTEAISQQTVAKNFPNLMKNINPQIQETQNPKQDKYKTPPLDPLQSN